MLLTHEVYAGFQPLKVGDARAASQMLIALTADSRDAVEAVAKAGAAAGGRIDPIKAQDHGFMCSRSVEDPDGYVWEIVWMDPTAAVDGPPQ